MPHKSQEARNEYMRDYKVRRRADPAFKQRERRERERYAERNRLATNGCRRTLDIEK